MIDFSHNLDLMSGASWAELLGMVHVPMFAAHKTPETADEAAILLDGSRGSFAFLRTEDAEFAEMIDPLSWSWSSCVRHIVTVLPNKERMYVRRWDEPQTIRKFEPPKQGLGVFSLLEMLEGEAEPRLPNVVRYVLEPFRQIRLRLNVEEPLLAVKFLNGLLLVAEAAKKQGKKQKIEAIKTFNDAFKLLSERERHLCELVDIPNTLAALDAGNLIQNIIAHENYTGCELYPSLLFRHAASKLYQEAHLEIERNPQGYFPGLEPTRKPVGVPSPRDVRFTPPNLARALVQKTLEVIAKQRRDLTILDPACGSGVFLIEAIREVNACASNRDRKIKAVGYDISPISEYTTRFCLEYATHYNQDYRTVQTEVARLDSLDHPWVNADIILMNPPFIPWERLTTEQRRKVSNELGNTSTYRPDIAMAFVSKAVNSLLPGGVLGCVLPASLLTSQSGFSWRKQLAEKGNLQLLGCFEGYKYFPTSLVETAFFVYQKRAEYEDRSDTVEILISNEGSEDASLRALRRESEFALSVKKVEGVELFKRSKKAFSPENWRPLRQEAYKKKDHIAALALPQVSNLFVIKQGARLGHPVFLLRDNQFKELNRSERQFFRPAAGGGTIRNGQLQKREYVFYPYAADGSALIESEKTLKSRMPTYYSRYLAPVKCKLALRKGYETTWWELYRKRAWQTTLSPRLVSTYFGESGSFAFDEEGQYVVVNGHAWFWATDTVSLSEDIKIPFEQTPSVWAYLAILNSKVFEEIMSLFSVRLQGGQMRLESRFLSQIPLPDVTDEMNCPAKVVDDLVGLGKAICDGELKNVSADLDRCVSLLYGF